MKTISKYRIFNKYNLFSFIAMLLILWVSWAFASYFIEILTMDYTAEDLAISSKEEEKEAMYQYIIGILTWERYIDSAMSYMVYLFPIFSLITVLPFCDEINGYYFYPARFECFNKSIAKGIMHHSVIGGVLISLVYIVFFSVGAFFMGVIFKLCKCKNHQNFDNSKNAAKEGNAEERPNADCEVIR